MRNRDDELREEIDAHLRMAAEARIARGASPADAAAAARRELGNIAQIQEATRDIWGRRLIERAHQDVRYALRVFRTNPVFAAVAVLSLALGIGANSALFEVVDALRLQTLPVPDPSRLVEVRLADHDGARGNFEGWHASVTNPIWEAIRDRQQALSGVFAWGMASFDLSNGSNTPAPGETAARSADALWVSGSFFDVLGVRPAAGRLLSPSDDRPGCDPRAVLSYAFWERAYAENPSVVGQTISLSSHPVEIVGVAASGFSGLDVGRSFDVAVPICAEPLLDDYDKGRLASGTDWWLIVFGRLKPGWSVERATAHFATISPELFRTTLAPNYPKVSVPKYLGLRLMAEPAGTGISQLREQYEAPLWILLATTGLVLLIACANLANLLLARATARQREIAIRLGLGASRGRIVRQLLTESLVLATLGGIAGTIIATWLGPACVRLLDAGSSETHVATRLDWRVLAFTAGLSLVTCLLFGLAPALVATRRRADVTMRITTRTSASGRESAAVRRALIVAQVALSVVLLFGSLLFARSLHNVLAVNPGFRPSGVLVAEIGFTRLNLPPATAATFRRSLLERVSAVPGVERAAMVSIMPISGLSSSNTVWAQADSSRGFVSLFNVVGPGYCSTLGIPLVAGRDFTDADTRSSPLVAIVNEAFVHALGRGPNVIGTRITREATPSYPQETFEIVAVVRNSKYMDLRESIRPVVFVADAQMRQPSYVRLAIRSTIPASALTPSITRALKTIDPRLAIDFGVLSAQIDDSLARDRMLATLSGWFGVLAAVLTLAGLYGLMAYTVARRTNEIGIRMALGARHRSIVRLVLGEAGLLVAVGAFGGAVLAEVAGRAAATLVFGIDPSDPATLGFAIAILTTIALAAAYLPARRATRIEPVVALRAE